MMVQTMGMAGRAAKSDAPSLPPHILLFLVVHDRDQLRGHGMEMMDGGETLDDG